VAFVITVALLKGGVGKTTTAVALAEAAAAVTGSAMLIDADPMGSAGQWAQRAAADGISLRATVVPTDPVELDRDPAALARTIAGAARAAGIVVVDAPPPGRLPIARVAIAGASVLVMPTTPGWQDLDRIPATLAMAAEQDVPAVAVLTMVRAGLPERDMARMALSQAGAKVLHTELPMTVAVQRNYGMPVMGPLRVYGNELLTELLEIEGGQ
jgi:chromosome partitioning protein